MTADLPCSGQLVMPVGDLGRLQFLQHDGAEVGNDLRDDQLPVTFCGFAGQAAMPVDPFKQIFADRGLAGVGQGAGGGRGDQLGQLDLGVALCAFEAGIADLAVAVGVDADIELQFPGSRTTSSNVSGHWSVSRWMVWFAAPSLPLPGLILFA